VPVKGAEGTRLGVVDKPIIGAGYAFSRIALTSLARSVATAVLQDDVDLGATSVAEGK
jgi:hypothetical protein